MLLQRVGPSRVDVDGRTVGSIDRGLLLLVGIHPDDDRSKLAWMAQKCAALRIFEDAEGKMNLASKDVGAQVLAVSQFTLYGDVTKGNRPSFISAAPPQTASRLFDDFVAELNQHFERVETGRFGAHMEVHLVNDGPVTLWLER